MSNKENSKTMKAIIENNKTYKITSERGDFFITEDNRGKLKMFAKKDVSVIEIDSMPKAKKYSKRTHSSKKSYASKQLDEHMKIAQHNEHSLDTKNIYY